MELQLFTDRAGRDLRWKVFLNTPLGRLYQAIPFSTLSKQFGHKSAVGRPPWLDVEGGIALQVLKAYLGLSDEKLVDRLNSDWEMQAFCGIQLKWPKRIRDKDLVGRWRRYLAKHIDYATFQATLAAYWQPHIGQSQAVLMDATCYETQLRYPTDVKLLWESCQWTWALLDAQCGQLGVRRFRRKQKALKQAFLNYQKRRRKTHKQERKIRQRLLYFLGKGLSAFDQLAFEHSVLLKQRTYRRLQTVRTVLQQQQQRFNDPQAAIKDRIVSLAKPYIRPIVRGKETKRTEFGPKVHAWQVDGITFIEYFSFHAFNESTHMTQTLDLHQQYFRPARQLGADQIYATNANRRYCTRNNITTCFVPKGPKPKAPDSRQHMRSILAKARSSQMEGTFGNEKQHYGLDKILAKTERTEKLWVCMGIWTAAAVKIGKRMAAAKHRALAA